MHRSATGAAALLRHLRLPQPKPLPPVATLTTTTTDNPTTAPPDDLASEVEKVYRILRRYHSKPSKLSLALHRYQEEQAGPLFLRPQLLERVLLRCGPSSSLSFPFFTWWSSRSPPSHAACSALLRSLSRSHRFDTAWALLDHLRLHHPHLLHQPDLFLPLIRSFASSRMASRALLLLDHDMPSRFGCSPDPHHFSSLLDALCKHGSVRHAAMLFDSMRDRFPPTLRHFTSLLHGWCREGRLLEAKHVLVQMKRAGIHPDVVVYNTLLAGLAAAGRIEDGYHLLLEMRRNEGCEPNAISYTTLMGALCARQRIDEAMRLLVEMRRNGCTADAVTFATLIGGLCKSGKLPDAYRLLEEMARDGCRPDAAAYFPLMVAHERKEQLEECLELMEKMRRDGCSPDLGIYNVAIRLSCKLGELRQAAALWEEVEASELTPGIDTFVILVNGFAQQGSPVEACGYFKDMVGRGLWSKPQYGTLKELLNSLLRDDKLRLAEDVWSCLVQKGCELNVFAWTIWIHALFSRKHVKVACMYCIEMMEAGLMPQADTFAKLMRGLKKLYNRHIAAEITEKVRKMAAEQKVSFKMYKRRGVRLLNEKAKAATEEGLRRRRAARRRGRDRASSMQLE